MIFDTLSNWERNKNQYGNAVRRALEFVAALDLASMPSTVELDGNRMYVMKQTPSTVKFDDRLSEIHALHADIHIVLDGEEWQAFAPASNKNHPIEDKLEQSDYALFQQVEDEMRVKLKAGAFTVYWPGEFHRPNCSVECSTPLIKLVVKIHRDLFD